MEDLKTQHSLFKSVGLNSHSYSTCLIDESRGHTCNVYGNKQMNLIGFYPIVISLSCNHGYGCVIVVARPGTRVCCSHNTIILIICLRQALASPTMWGQQWNLSSSLLAWMFVQIHYVVKVQTMVVKQISTISAYSWRICIFEGEIDASAVVFMSCTESSCYIYKTCKAKVNAINK